MINYFDFYKPVSGKREAFNQKQCMSLKSVANMNDKNCINKSKLYKHGALSNVSYMSKLKEISESQLIGYK
jgi:hypothetical protein